VPRHVDDMKRQAAGGSSAPAARARVPQRGAGAEQARSSVEGPIMEPERGGCIVRLWPLANWKLEEPAGRGKAVQATVEHREPCDSRGHARFWDRPEVKFLRATRQTCGSAAVERMSFIGGSRPVAPRPANVP
jgi:hypothetical protein